MRYLKPSNFNRANNAYAVSGVMVRCERYGSLLYGSMDSPVKVPAEKSVSKEVLMMSFRKGES
jgi:hypothetical protein